MISCEFCKRRHRTEEQVSKCKETQERREARADKKAKDQEARATWLEKEGSIEAYIIRRKREGANWSNIRVELNSAAPLPAETSTGKYEVWQIIDIDSRHLNWPEKGAEVYWPPERVSIGKLQEQYWNDKERDWEHG
jgi:hypothetical protein